MREKKMAVSPVLIRPPRFAKSVDVSTQQVYRWIYVGQLKATQVGYAWFIPVSELTEFFEREGLRVGDVLSLEDALGYRFSIDYAGHSGTNDSETAFFATVLDSDQNGSAFDGFGPTIKAAVKVAIAAAMENVNA